MMCRRMAGVMGWRVLAAGVLRPSIRCKPLRARRRRGLCSVGSGSPCARCCAATAATYNFVVRQRSVDERCAVI